MSVYAIETVASVHSPRGSNTRADDLSRGVAWDEMQARYPELERVPWWEADTAELILLFDPNVQLKTDEGFVGAWRQIMRILEE